MILAAQLYREVGCILPDRPSLVPIGSDTWDLLFEQLDRFELNISPGTH